MTYKHFVYPFMNGEIEAPGIIPSDIGEAKNLEILFLT